MADNWRLRAKCGELSIQESEALFFPDSGRAKNAAVAYCNSGCPVLAECLDFALRFESKGIYAGTTYKERLVIKAFRQQLNGTPPTNPRGKKKPKRSGFTIT